VVGMLLENIYAKEIYVNDAILKQESNYNYYDKSQSYLGQPIAPQKVKALVHWQTLDYSPCLNKHMIALEVNRLIVCLVLLHRKFVIHWHSVVSCGVLCFDLPLSNQ
jgi:hypothetical protein